MKYRLYEKIDWNDPKIWEDFTDVLKGKKGLPQKQEIKDPIEGQDYIYLGKGINDEIGSYKIYQPLTYDGSRALASNKVPPIKDNGAKWCIANNKTSKWWDNCIANAIHIFFLLTYDTKFAVIKYSSRKIEVYSFDGSNLGNPEWLKNDENIQEVLKNLKSPEVITFKKYITIENDGSISLLKKKGVDFSATVVSNFIRSHIVDGKFDVKFKRWEAMFNCSWTKLTSLEGAPEYVEGGFYCSDCSRLKSLKGSPKEVKGDFDCQFCTQITSLEGAPKYVGGGFYCNHCKNLKSLKGIPEYVGKSFSCPCTSITSLEGVPKKIKGDFHCSSCKNLKSLKGAPEYVEGDFYCDRCENLTSLEGSPEYVGRDFCCYNCENLTSLEGAPEHVGGGFYCYNCKNLKSLKGAPKVS